MITNITLENFKCFRKVEVNPRLITVLIGPNGTGKSSVLQGLALLKQSIGANGIRHQGEFLSLPSVTEIVPKWTSSPTNFRIEFSGAVNRSDVETFGFDERVKYRYGANFASSGPMTASYGYTETEFDGKRARVEVPEDPQEFTEMNEVGGSRVLLSKINNVARLVDVGGWVGSVTPAYQNGLPLIISTTNHVLEKLRFIPAIRGLVRPSYPLGDKFVEDPSLSSGLSGQEEQIASNLGYSLTMEDILSGLLYEVTGSGLRAETVPPRSVEVRSLAASGSVNIVAEGFGTNALILLFHQLIGAAKGATVLIEEPEIHLHPRAQAELASVLAESAKSEDKQLIMTTHSEHVLGRLLTLVAEGKLAKEELAIYSFEKDDQGVCTADEIEVMDDGRVIGGLKSFFESELDELDRYMRALKPSE